MIKKLNIEALLNFGFKKVGDVFVFEAYIANGELKMIVTVSQNGEMITRVEDAAFGDEYTLHLVEGAQGSFVGEVRDEYQGLITLIEEKCFERGYKTHSQVKEILDGVLEKYSALPEYPFEDDNETAVLRRNDSQKWFGIIMSISPKKLGLEGNGNIEVINIKVDPEELNRILDNEKYFRAYHMNKKLWMTLVLDGRLPTAEIMKRIEDSFNLVGAKKKGK